MADSARPAATSFRLILGLTAYAQYIVGLRALVAPFLRTEWSLDDTQITLLQGVISIGALGTFALTRWADVGGRRRILLYSFAGLPPICLLTALAPGPASYALLGVFAATCNGALLALLTVLVSEVAAEDRRTVNQAWFGFVTALGAGGFLMLSPLLSQIPGGWRWAFALVAPGILALPALRRRVIESGRFERAEAAGRTQASSAFDLFRGVYRRRALAMIIATTLRPVAIISVLSWQYDHALNAMGLSAAEGSLVMIAGGALGIVGYPLGVRLSNRWGRKPTVVTFSAVGIGGGIAYYFVPQDASISPMFWMIVWSTIEHTGLHIFGVADRCLDTEAFPTHMRGTYTGWTRVSMAVAAIAAQFALSALTLVTDGLPVAIAILSLAAYLPSIPIFLWGAPETRGLLLDEASLEAEQTPA